MVVDKNSSTRDNNSVGTKGTPITSTLTQQTQQVQQVQQGKMEVGLAKYNNISRWQPKLTDFIIWHGWIWGRWYGIINGINGDNIRIIKDGLPYLLLTMGQSQHNKNTIEIPVSKIQGGRNGEYHIFQDNIWYI